jgi:uncharacterized protein (TIGR02271 family)
MTKSDLLRKYPHFAEGTKVRSRDNENLGKVLYSDENYFVIEKGLFFPKDFSISYDDVRDFTDGTAYLKLSKDELSEWKEPGYTGWRDIEDINAGKLKAEPKPEYKERYEARVPVTEEELEAKKTVHEAPGVTIRKVVHTDYKHLTIPVMREEVHVERKPVMEREAAPGEAFKGEEVTIPIREEEVEVKKRPIVKEEVKVRKEAHIEEKEVSGMTRKEEVKIEGGKKKTA